MVVDDQDPDAAAASVAETQRRLARALRTGVVENPDALAADRAEAARLGMPVSRLRAMREVNGPLPPASYETNLPVRAPGTSNFLSDPRNAAVAHDDIENLSGIEGALRFTGDLGRRVAGAPGILGSSIAGLSRGGERIADRLGVPEDSPVQRLLEGGVDFGARVELGARNIAGTLNERERALYGSDPRLLPDAGETGFAGEVVDALGQIGTQVAATVATGGLAGIPLLTGQGLRGMDVRIEEDMAREGRTERTVADDIALGGGGAISLVTEKLGLDSVLGRLPPALKARIQGRIGSLLMGGVGEGTTEVADTIGQNLLAASLLGEDVSPTEGAPEAGAVGTTAGAIAALTVDLLTPGRRKSQARAEADAAAAEEASRTFQDLNTLSAASRLREREPQTFQQFVEQVTEGRPLENIYVEAETFAQTLNQSGVSIDEIAQAIPSLAEQLPNALATGGDLRITAGEYAAHIAATDAGAGLLQHLRADAHGMSQAQAKEFMATKGEALQAEVEAAVVEATANEELTAGRERVRAKITADLNAAGRFTNDVNDAYASLPAAFYDVMAKRTGMTAEELAEKYQLRYAADLPSSTGRQVMDQEETIDLIHFSDRPGIAMSDPSRWGAAGVTQNSERERRNAGAPGRTYFGVQGVYNGEPETGISGRSFRYRARVPASKVYDFDADPQNLRPTEGTPMEIATAYEKAIQEAGFSGYRSDAAVPGAVALFEATGMQQIGPVRNTQDAQQLSARMRELAYQDRLARLAASTNPNESIATRPAEDFREQATAELFPGGTFAQEPLTPAQASARAAKLADEIPGLKGVLPYLTADEKAKLRRDTAAKITKLVEDFPDAEEMAAVAYSGRAKRGWYENSATAIRDIFGATDAPRFAALLAALSPQTSVESNAFNALAVWTNWINAGRPTGQREIVKIMGESVQGKGTEESVLNAWINNSVSALTVENPNDIVLSGPKVNSFMLNLIGVVDEVTNDSWMANYALVEQSVFKKTGAVPGKGPGYIAMNAVARKAAEIVSQKTGQDWSAAEVQETVWSWAKTLYEMRDAKGEKRTTSEILAAGGLTAEDIGSTPDFAVLFVGGVFRRILEAGGYGAELDALDARGQPARRDGAGGDPRSVEGTGFDEGDFARYVDQAAARLEELRARRREGEPGQAPQLSLFNQGPVELPLQGAPKANIPSSVARQAAIDYVSGAGIAYRPPTDYIKVNPERAARIAQAFEDMKHDPENPEVKASYRALIDETVAQYQVIKATGLKIEFIDFQKTGDPYAASPRMAISDVRENNHLWVFKTDDGHGSEGDNFAGNPLLEKTNEFIDGRQLLANDVFRIVHDYFGHIKDGNGFRSDGEDNAWRSHSAMYSPLARRAMTAETRGQNSYVNFGPNGEFNRTASAGETKYAPQKVGLLPLWVSEDAEPNVLFQSDPFYSAVERAVENEGPESATVAEWKRFFGEPESVKRGVKRGPDNKPMMNADGTPVMEETIVQARPRPGLKKEEIDLIGLNDWLDLATTNEDEQVPFGVPSVPLLDANGKISKDDVLALVRAKGLVLDEVVLGGVDPDKDARFDARVEEILDEMVEQIDTFGGGFSSDHYYDEVEGGWALFYNGQTIGDEVFETEAEADAAAQEANDAEEQSNVQAYRNDMYRVAERQAEDEFENDTEQAAQFESYMLDGMVPGSYREILLRLPNVQGPGTHWDQNNVVAHARIAEAPVKMGEPKTMVIGELQSDWHQMGRDKGYAVQPTPEQRADAIANRNEAMLAFDKAATAFVNATADRLDETAATYRSVAQQEVDRGLADRVEGTLGHSLAQRHANEAYRLRQQLVDAQDPTAVGVLNRAYRQSAYIGRSTDWVTSTETTDGKADPLLFLRQWAEDANLRQNEADQVFQSLGQGVPEGPFQKSWDALLMKRMIRYAADNGFERVVIINGNQQNGGKTGGDGTFFYEGTVVNTANALIKKYGSRVEKFDMFPTPDREAIIADRATGEQVRRELLEHEQMIADAGGIARAQERLDSYLEETQRQLAGSSRSAYLDAADERIAAAEARGDTFLANVIREESANERARLLRPSTSLGVQNGFLITPELAEAARAGFALFQKDGETPRGQIAFGADISQTPSVISLLRKADLSTFIHETGHFFLEATADMANATDAPPDIVADMATILNWMRPGMTLAEWNTMSLEERRPFHEKWARGFEAYHFEGNSPSLALVDQFRRFSAWLKNVYRSLTDLNVELTDDVRAVMDRMLASEAEITEMEQVRGLTPSFTSKPEFASDDEWREYQLLAGDATATAIEQLEQRSARDMRWASGAKDRYLRQLQREGEEQRKAIRAEVTAEVMAEPVNRARAFLRRGLGENGQPVENAAKLDLATLKALYGDAPARPAGPVGLFAAAPEGPAWTKLRRGGKYAEVGTDGMHPDEVASMFGYRNGEALIDDLVNGEDSAEKIKGLTDQRMLERYGDLADAQAIDRAANEAVANEARAKFVQAEMAMADKAVGKRSILNSAAKLFANSVVNRLEMRRLRPQQYIAAQARAAKTAEKALRNDDLPGFAAAKRNQLINLHTGHAVQKAQKDGEKTMRLFTRIVSAKDDSIGRSRDMNLVNAARAILALHGVGRVKNDPIGYMDLLKQYDPTLYTDLAPFIDNARVNAKPVDQLTYEEFQALRDTVNQLWALSKRTKQMEIDGQMIDRQRVSTELRVRLEQLRKPGKEGGYTRAPTPRQRFDHMLLGLRAAMTRVETWARGTDPIGEQGPFTRYIWNPISEAADRYTAESGDYTRRLRALLETVRDDMGPRDIKSPEIGHIFNGKMELLHALLHSGNGSNKSKLLLGWKWGKLREDGSLDDSRWQAMLDRMHADGTITQRDWIFVQSVWDLLEETKPGAQRAHFAIYGRYFDEVSADPVITPFGELRGGYVPALTDTLLVQDAALRAEQEAIEGGDSAMFPAASNGFTKARKENYTRELALNLGLLSQHLDKVLRFTHLGPPVRDVARLLKDKGFSKALQDYDPSASTELLLPWLQRSAKQLVETPMKGGAGKLADRFFNGMRRNVGMQLMFANVVNTAQQLTGMSMASVRVKPHRLADALWTFMRDPKGVSEAALARSQLLTNRANTDIFEARQAITEITKLDPNALDQARDWSMRHAYVLQSALQNQMDVVIWTGAFNQAIIKGESEKNAARFADSVIRETQHSMTPTDIARFETGHPMMRIFTQFAGWFNMAANLGAAEFRLLANGDLNFRQKAGRLFYVYLNVVAIPAFIGEAIAVALRGGLEDDEGDGYIDELLQMFFMSQAKFALAAVPVVGQAANAVIGSATKAPYDDRISLSPSVSVLESGAGVPYAIYQGIVEGKEFNRQDVRNTLNLLGVMTGLPLGAVGRPVGYAVGVAQGEIQPTSAADAIRGAITGAPSPESKTQ